MDAQVIHTYNQRTELNDECDRIYCEWDGAYYYILNYFRDIKHELLPVIDQVILINGNISNTADPAWKSVIQTLKRFIKKTNAKVAHQISSNHKEITEQLSGILKGQEEVKTRKTLTSYA